MKPVYIVGRTRIQQSWRRLCLWRTASTSGWYRSGRGERITPVGRRCRNSCFRRRAARRQSRRTYHRQGRLVGDSRGASDDDEGRSRRLAGRLGRVREAVRLQRVPPDCASALSTLARIGVVDEEEERVVAATGGSHACTPRMDGITAIVTPTRFRDLKEERSLWKILHPTRHTRPVCLGRQ